MTQSELDWVRRRGLMDRSVNYLLADRKEAGLPAYLGDVELLRRLQGTHDSWTTTIDKAKMHDAFLATLEHLEQVVAQRAKAA
jgi:hypothetical protein